MLVLTLWPVAKWREVLPVIRDVRPGALMIHSDPATLEARASGIVNGLRAELGEAMPGEIWLGVAFDVYAKRTAERLAARPGDREAILAELQRDRLRAVSAAQATGAANVMLNAEAAWKHKRPGFDDAAARESVAQYRAALPGRRITVTSFDCPGYHAMPWAGFDTADGWAPQVYAAPAKGAQPDRASKQGRGRLAMHQRHWADATRKGWLQDRLPIGYVQAHHVIDRETCWIANAFDEVAMWAFPTRLDTDGVRAAKALAAIERQGFTGRGRVEAFQRAHGLAADGLVGAQTLRALGIAS